MEKFDSTTFDAREWAEEFVGRCEEKPSIATDVGAMTAWFASAIMAGYDHAKKGAVTLINGVACCPDSTITEQGIGPASR
jgi:hypothetical protein